MWPLVKKTVKVLLNATINNFSMTIGLGVVCKTELQFGARYLEEFLPKLENKMRYQSLIIDLGIPYSLMVLFTNLSVIVLAVIKWLKVRKWDDLLNLSNYHNPFPNSYGGWVIKVKENSKIFVNRKYQNVFFFMVSFFISTLFLTHGLIHIPS